MSRPFMRRPRRALTLIELIVTIALIMLIATLGYFLLPAFNGPSNVSNAADRISGWLLIAKQRAKRDGLPTGLRISKDPVTGNYSVFQYIQQPDVFATGRCILTGTAGTAAPANTVTFSYNFGSSGRPDVQVGDYLELYGGPVHQITNVNGPVLTIFCIPTFPKLGSLVTSSTVVA